MLLCPKNSPVDINIDSMCFILLLLFRYLDKRNVVVTEAMLAELTASKGEWSSAERKRFIIALRM